MAKIDYSALAAAIMENVGGSGNIALHGCGLYSRTAQWRRMLKSNS